MIIDANLLFSDNQAITADANSTNVVDLGTTRDISRGQPLRCRVQVGTAFTSGGAGTLVVQLVQSAAADLSSPDVLLTTGTLALATLAAGYVAIDAVVPKTSKRYLGIIYDNGTAVFTGGTVTAALVLDTATPQADRVLGNTGL